MPLSRNGVIAALVVLLHVAFIWALQSGLLMRAAEIVVPAEILTRFVDAPAPQAQPQPPAPPAPPAAVKKSVVKAPARPSPTPLAISDPAPSPTPVSGAMTAQPVSTPVPAQVAAAPASPPAAATVQLPSSDADYLQNPKPAYPPMSRRLDEQGKTVVRVFIGVDGLPQRPEIFRSSGYERLDQAALTGVMRWRFVPGKRGGVPEAMWFNVPINWVLD
ncbi:MAG TPA: TonB family protein [Polaromonas sp.]|uniref:energy transducer TonB n=1 Tax=Polaromonas sp. TaxID=1869339 RepID=UPI002D47D3AC|nr:TonB family protein [Polaromonas sp.]HYW57746.1 TonB family protein [Polaromonas sp.]